MNAEGLKKVIFCVSKKMKENRDYLIELDQKNGDGDLGLSMDEGFQAVVNYLNSTDELDLGRLLMKSGSTFNEAAPSSLGTIISFAFMGMAKELKGKTEASFEEVAIALSAGVQKIMERAGSKPGEKTILDSIYPATEVLIANSGDKERALQLAANAAAKGSEKTKTMKSVHGRAAYYGEKSIGILDGGSVVGKLIFEAINEC